MLAQVLNRDFVHGTLEATERQVRAVMANREAGVFINPRRDQVSDEELRELAELLTAALRKDAEGTHEMPAMQHGEEPAPPKEDYAYVPRDPVLGLFQSTLDNHLSRELVTQKVQMLDDRRAGPTPAVTDLRVEGIDLKLTAEGKRLWRKMEIAQPKVLSDPRWILSVASMAKRVIRGRALFVPRPAEPPPLADRARIVLVGDWGSGLPRALKVAERIREQLTDPEASRREKHVIHLGDVYYGGEESEYIENFLNPWPVAAGTSDAASYTLNGNHDMYEGGHAYYGKALSDARFAAQGGSSMFVLANDHWQFLGLDTSYEEGGLHGNQADWIRQLRREHPNRKTVLLSHHQLFSAYESGAVSLRQKIRPLLKEKEIDAWFWGHEHRCLAYRDLEGVRFASCVGHGGIPEYLVEESLVRPKGLVYEYRKPFSTSWQPWITFGFAVLDIDGPHIVVRYVDEDGNEHWRTELP
jgi:hypothetical protein